MKVGSLTRKATVVCPVCMEEFQAEFYRVINLGDEKFSSFDPSQINRAVCPSCGNEFRIAERVLIYNPEEEVIFFVYPDPEEDVKLVRTTFRELKSVLKDLEIPVPEMALIIGWERFIIFWELRNRRELLVKIMGDEMKEWSKLYFYKKLEQLAEIYQEHADSANDLESDEIVEKVTEHFRNIVDI